MASPQVHTCEAKPTVGVAVLVKLDAAPTQLLAKLKLAVGPGVMVMGLVILSKQPPLEILSFMFFVPAVAYVCVLFNKTRVKY